MSRPVPSHPVVPGQPLRGRHVAVVNWRDLDHSLAGGSERYAWEAARAALEAGATVEYVTAREPGQARVEVRDGVVVRRGGGAFGYYAYAAWRLLRHRRRIDAVVDPECGIPSWSPLFVRRRTPVLLVLHHVHQQQFLTYFPRPLALLGQWLERVAMPRVYRDRPTFAVSDSTRVEMREQLGWSGPVGLIQNGTEAPDLDEDGFLDQDPDRLLALGRLVPHKRVDLVLEVLATLLAERPSLHLDVCGQGPERERLEVRAGELGVADHVTFHGYVDEETKDRLLRRAAVHVCASDIEGWGQVVVEAAGYGVPTVARDVPGLRDSVRDGETGRLVPDPVPDYGPAMVAGLAEATALVLDAQADPAQRATTYAVTRAWASRFSWARMRAQVVEVLADGLGARAPRPPTSSEQSCPTTPTHPSHPARPGVSSAASRCTV